MKETGGTNNSRMKNKGRNQPPRPKPQGRVISPIKTVRVIVSAFRDCKIYGCLRSDHTRVCVCVCAPLRMMEIGHILRVEAPHAFCLCPKVCHGPIRVGTSCAPEKTLRAISGIGLHMPSWRRAHFVHQPLLSTLQYPQLPDQLHEAGTVIVLILHRRKPRQRQRRRPPR